MSPEEERRRLLRLHVAAAVVVAVVAVGFITGTRGSLEVHGYQSPSVGVGGEEPRPPAPTYATVEHASHAERWRAQIEGLASLVLGRGERREGAPPDPERWSEAVAARATRRAFHGAPPTVPHAVDQAGYPSCLACHESGARIEGRVAPMMSHERLESCLQCHAPTAGPMVESAPSLPAVHAGSTFEGAPSPGRGARAWEGAPPRMPHGEHMRERCISCHGGPSGLSTSHPERQSCQQCHAPADGQASPARAPFRETRPAFLEGE